ncbi:MAG TPA: ankyrin repeat domain-containing protein [Vicinamibacterales bacterium]|nr:ankyrin repeat domain-containing protein [Vicinamibacterales bacterium]
MELKPLAFNAPLEQYIAQADALFAGWNSSNAGAVRVFRNRHPKFLDDKIPWLERHMTDAEVRATPIDRDDARLALARWYEFQDWQRLAEYVASVQQPGPTARFERAVEAVIDGDIATLKQLLAEDPGMVRARSTRVNHFDPPMHRSTLLHYVAANGVEGYRQRSPKNAAQVAKVLLDAGADPNALSWAYGGQCTTMALLVSSTPPAQAGVQVPLVETLIDYGASVAPAGEGNWTSPVETALVFGKHDAAQALVRRGAPIESLAAAAGLGRIEDVKRMLPSAEEQDRHRALALAAQSGQAEAVSILLDAGEDPNRFNPPGTHSHTPPIHQAIAAGHLAVVKLLVERGARLDIKDTIHQGTPLGWAKYCDQPAIAAYLQSVGSA